MAVGERGKVAVVIGVGAREGTGAALCRRFAREGLHTFVAGRTQAKIEAVAEEISTSGGAATAVVTDTTQSGDVCALLDRAIAEGGSLDLVVYNAGNNRFSSVLDMTDEFFEEVWRIGCFGGFLVGREAARRMLPQGSGSILFTGATASLRASDAGAGGEQSGHEQPECGREACNHSWQFHRLRSVASALGSRAGAPSRACRSGSCFPYDDTGGGIVRLHPGRT